MPCGVEAMWGELSLDGLGEMLSPPPPSLSPGLRILSAVCKFQRIFFFFYNPSLFLVFQFPMCNTEGRPVCDLELASLFSHWALRPISFDDDDDYYDDYDDDYYYFLAIQGKNVRLTSQWLPTGLPISTDQPRILLASGICNSLLPTSSEGREEVRATTWGLPSPPCLVAKHPGWRPNKEPQARLGIWNAAKGRSQEILLVCRA